MSIRALRASVVVGLALLAGCATTQLSEPVGRGRTRVSASLGGPMVRLGGAPIPVPISTVGVAHGLSETVDVHGDLHPTALLFSSGDGSVPVLGADLGAAWHPLPAHPAALTIGATVYGFTNRLDAVLLADPWIATGVRASPWLFVSAGLHNGLRVASTDETLRARTPWAPIVFAMASLRPGAGPFALQLEARWYAPNENGARLAPAWVTLGDLGALGIVLGVSYEFERGGR